MPKQQCPKCRKQTLGPNGKPKGRQAWRCRNCNYSRIDGAGIHGSTPKVKSEPLTQKEKNHRSKPPTGTKGTGKYWYVICDSEGGFIELIRGKRSEMTGDNVRLLSSYPAAMRRLYWERRSEDNNVCKDLKAIFADVVSMAHDRAQTQAKGHANCKSHDPNR